MTQSQIDLLQNNNYKIIKGEIVNMITSCPPIDILYDETTNKFCLGIKMLKILEEDFDDFQKLFIEYTKLIHDLNSI